MTDPLSFVVLGRPQPAGSKKAFAIRRGGQLTGRVTVVDDAKHSRSWKHDVAVVAREAMGTRPPMSAPVELDLVFYVGRPKGHYGQGRNAGSVKASAPAFPATRPDCDKLSRAVLDALSGLVYGDDGQVVVKTVRKVYGWPERCEVTVRLLQHSQGAVGAVEMEATAA